MMGHWRAFKAKWPWCVKKEAADYVICDVLLANITEPQSMNVYTSNSNPADTMSTGDQG